MGKREAFWQSIYAEDGESIAWPSSDEAKKALASRILGASMVGAVEHIVTDALSRADGAPPPPGADNHAALLRDAEVLSSLTPAQHEVVGRLLRETAYFSLYWPLVKAGNLPGAALNLTVTPTPREGAAQSAQPIVLTDFFGPHVLFLQWVEEFGEILDGEPRSAPGGSGGP
jgi:hypothetical protein